MSEALSLLVPANYKPLVAEKKEFRGQPIQTEVQFIDGIPQPDDIGSLAEAYSAHVWVYAAVWAIASNYAQLGYKAYQRNEDDDQFEEIIDDPFVALLENPNPFTSGYQLRELNAMSLELTGNAYMGLEVDGRGDPVEIWPIPSAYMLPVASKTAPIDHYIYRINGQDVRYEFNEVIHLQYMNPVSFYYGQGSLEAVKQSVMTDIYAASWNKYFFKNAARPDSVFEVDNVLGEDVKKRVLAGWKAMHQGSGNRGKTAILEGGLKLKETGWNHSDMEFTNLRKMMREEVLGAFGVPPAMVGIMEYANYANVKEQKEIFWKHTMIPKVRSIQDKITMRARQIMLEPGLHIESDVSQVEALRVDEKQRSETATAYWKMGVPLNAIIDKFDLPFDPVEGGDESKPQVGGGAFGAAGIEETPEAVPAKRGKALPPQKDAALINEVHWKAFDAKLTPIEDRFITALKMFFRAQQRRVKDAFEQHAHSLLQRHGVTKAEGNKPKIDVGVFFDQAKEQKRMKNVVHDYISGTYVDFAVESGKKINPAFKFNLQDPRVLAWLHEKELTVVQQVTAYTMEQLSDAVVDSIQDAVEEGIAQGETIKEIASKIDDVYQLANENRSELIARTETLSASNAGSLEGMEQAGAEGKMWLAAQNSKAARDWHQKMDGVVVPVSELFILETGAKMDAPGDPAGGPEEICNCRCTIRSVRRLGDE
jgi:HK97 family phage portal protein